VLQGWAVFEEQIDEGKPCGNMGGGGGYQAVLQGWAVLEERINEGKPCGKLLRAGELQVLQATQGTAHHSGPQGDCAGGGFGGRKEGGQELLADRARALFVTEKLLQV